MQGLFLSLASPGAVVTISEQRIPCFEKFMSQISKKNYHQSAVTYCFPLWLTCLTYGVI